MAAHPLDGPFQRVNRAAEHLDDLRERLSDLGREQTEAFVPYFNPAPPHGIKLRPPPQTTMFAPMSIGVRIGEVCYNLRSAMDYFIFELARFDSGGIAQDGTQFPIEDKPKGFKWRQNRGWLKGINPAHVAAIELLQPYAGCSWSGPLRDFSDRDKHREFVNIRGEFIAHAYARTEDPNFDSIRETFKTTAEHPIIGNVDVKVHIRIEITFADGTPIIDTLDEIKAGVTQALHDFKPEFQRR